MSDYNLWHERLLAERLTADEWRLAIALTRLLLGFRHREESLGRALVMETAGMTSARSMERARDGLVQRRLIEYEPPERRGPGARGRWKLLLGDDVSAAPQRHLGTSGSAAPERQISAALSAALSAAPARPRIEEGVETSSPLTPRKRGDRSRASTEERRASRFATRLSDEERDVFDRLDEDCRAEVVEQHGRATGLRWLRGTHSGSYRADPLGTENARGLPAGQLPPFTKPTPGAFLRARYPEPFRPTASNGSNGSNGSAPDPPSLATGQSWWTER